MFITIKRNCDISEEKLQELINLEYQEYNDFNKVEFFKNIDDEENIKEYMNDLLYNDDIEEKYAIDYEIEENTKEYNDVIDYMVKYYKTLYNNWVNGKDNKNNNDNTYYDIKEIRNELEILLEKVNEIIDNM